MARSQMAAAPAKAKSHRPSRTVTKKTTMTRAAVEFNPSEHHQEIALAAYYCWLERGDAQGSPEEDWSRAEAQVRGRYV